MPTETLEKPSCTLQSAEYGVRSFITGGPGSGKTHKLAEKVVEVLKNGASPNDIRVVVASAQTITEFRSLLKELGVTLSEGLWIGTTHDLCIEILSTPHALESTGRTPRVLNAMEMAFLLEDMKTLGESNTRLKEMLAFFYRQLTELGNDDENWLISVEEKMVFDALQRHLVNRGAVIEPELSNITVNYVRGNVDEAARFVRPYLLVDDFQTLSKASQTLLDLIADGTFIITSDKSQHLRVDESFPYAGGIDEFVARNPHATPIGLKESHRCPQRIAAASNALALVNNHEDSLLSCDAKSPQGTFNVVEWRSSAEEFLGITTYIKRRITAEELEPQDIFVSVPNENWKKNIVKTLRHANLPVTTKPSRKGLKGNPTKLDACASQRAYTILNLLADPQDAVAWRSWFGYGDYLLGSVSWCKLEVYACERKIGIAEALREISQAEETDIPEIPKLKQSYLDAQKILQAAAGRIGFKLMDVLEQHGVGFTTEIESLCGYISGTETAGELFERVKNQLDSPLFKQECIRVGTAKESFGGEYRLVIALGCVNGFTPSHKVYDTRVTIEKQEMAKNEERYLFHALISKTNSELMLSFPRKEELALAEPLGMEVRRIRTEQGKRIAQLYPCCYIEEMGDSAPGPVSGEQLLS